MFKLISCSTSAGSREEGELPADAASPGGMEIEETSFVQQMHDALKEGSADVPPTPDVDPSAADTGTDLSPLGKEIREMNESDRVPPLMTCALSLLLVKLKEAGTSSGALESAPTNEGKIDLCLGQIRLNLHVIYGSSCSLDIPMHEPIEGEAIHATKVDDFNDFDFNISEDDHQQILDSLLEKASGPATGSDVGIGSTEAGPSESKTLVL